MELTKSSSKLKKVTEMHEEPTPYFEWKYELNKDTGEHELKSIDLSDGGEIDVSKIEKTLKRTVGTSNAKLGEKILRKISHGLTSAEEEQRINDASALLTALRPQDETEAMLLGQFLALQESGMRCMRLANLPKLGFYHEERLFLLANKLFNTANQTMQTVLKYRTRGQQTVQVVHVHNEGQAIVAQNLVPSSKEEGLANKNTN